MSHMLWVLVGFASFLGVILSPFLLMPFSAVRSVDWQTLADIGQTFSFPATILSGAALFGVVVSMRYQRQQVHISQLQQIRSAHFELAKMAMSEPEKYGKYWGYTSRDVDRLLRDGYINQVLNYAKTGWTVGITSEVAVEAIAKDLFRSSHGRNYWSDSRAGWYDQSQLVSSRRFFEIIDSAYDVSMENFQ